MRESGVPEAAASISDSAMHTLIHEYARHVFKPSFFAAILWGGCLLFLEVCRKKEGQRYHAAQPLNPQILKLQCTVNPVPLQKGADAWQKGSEEV